MESTGLSRKEWEYINKRFDHIEKALNRLGIAICVMQSKEQYDKMKREIERMEDPNPDLKDMITKLKNKIKTEYD